MQETNQVPTSRIEAFSDGVIAIIITIMVFDLKLPELASASDLLPALKALLPKILSYALSFLVLGIMWANHHQMFHQISRSDRNLLWYNMLLLFWMSLIPFATNFLGANPMMWQASLAYALVFFLCALSFTLLRDYVVKTDLLHLTISRAAQRRILRKNRLAMAIYATAAVVSLLSVYISFILFLVVPAMYFIPEKIVHDNTPIS
jgi:uncharacterized membrane protein